MGIRDWFRAPVPLTAAAATVDNPGQLDSPYTNSARNTAEAWRVWRQVGEIHYATTQQARLVSRVGWDVALDGVQLEPEDRDRLLDEAFGSGVIERIAKDAALHLQVSGGYYLARLPIGWQVFSISPSYRAKDILKSADILVTVTTPDPEDPQRPDSPVIAALDVAREIILTRAQSRAQARNRTAQHGLVLFPLEGTPDAEAFKRNLTTVIAAPLSDELSAASVVPNLVGFAGDWIDKWNKLDIGGDYDDKLDKRLDALIRQLSVILDAPPQLLLGLGDVNHWTAWAVQEDNWFGHIGPLASEVGSGFAQALAAALDTDPDRVEVNPDPTPLVQRRPALTDVAAAHAAGVVSDDYWRTQLGADEDDAGPGRQVEAAPEEPAPAEEPQPAVEPTAAAAGLTWAKVQAITAAPVRPPFSTRRLMEIDRQALDSTIDLAGIALQRVAERVGAQIRARAQGDPDLRQRLADVPNEELPRRLGDQLATLPGLDQTINDTLTSVLPRRWGTLVQRAFSATRAAGIDVELDQGDLEESYNALVAELAGVAVGFMLGQPTDAAVWKAAQRALALAGGSADPAPPVIAALGLPSPLGLGIALGGKALLWVAKEVGLLARNFRWVYGSDPRRDPHPMHQSLDGQVFDGEALVQDGIRWYPGDHGGCLCGVEPVWEEVS